MTNKFTPFLFEIDVCVMAILFHIGVIWLGVSEWCVMSSEQFFSYIMVTSYIQWNDADVHFVLELNWILIVLAHWNNSLTVDMSIHLLTLSCFLVNQSLLLHLNAAYDLEGNMCITVKPAYAVTSIKQPPV